MYHRDSSSTTMQCTSTCDKSPIHFVLCALNTGSSNPDWDASRNSTAVNEQRKPEPRQQRKLAEIGEHNCDHCDTPRSCVV